MSTSELGPVCVGLECEPWLQGTRSPQLLHLLCGVPQALINGRLLSPLPSAVTDFAQWPMCWGTLSERPSLNICLSGSWSCRKLNSPSPAWGSPTSRSWHRRKGRPGDGEETRVLCESPLLCHPERREAGWGGGSWWRTTTWVTVHWTHMFFPVCLGGNWDKGAGMKDV